MSKIEVLHDEPYSKLVNNLAQVDKRVADLLDPDAKPLPQGTVIEGAFIDERGKAHYRHPDNGEPYYSPAGWFKVVGDE